MTTRQILMELLRQCESGFLPRLFVLDISTPTTYSPHRTGCAIQRAADLAGIPPQSTTPFDDLVACTALSAKDWREIVTANDGEWGNMLVRSGALLREINAKLEALA